MKKIIAFLILSFFLFTSSFASELDLPKKVIQKFKIQYPAAHIVDYTVVEKAYVIQFDKNGNKGICTFDRNGQWVETVTIIPIQDLPKKVVPFVKEILIQPTIQVVKKIEQPYGITYSLEFDIVEIKEDKIIPDDITLYFDEQGGLIE